jgi:hypothetical protein
MRKSGSESMHVVRSAIRYVVPIACVIFLWNYEYGRVIIVLSISLYLINCYERLSRLEEKQRDEDSDKVE